MTCHFVSAGGVGAIVCMRGGRKKRCACGRAATLLCDWKLGAAAGRTCDRPVCAACAQGVGPDKHLCQEHQAAYRDWQARHGRAP
jgi:hypothetical protein